MFTEIIEPQNETYVLRLPKEYVNQRVEISLALVTDKAPSNLREAALRACGILNGAIKDPSQWQRELRSEWNASCAM